LTIGRGLSPALVRVVNETVTKLFVCGGSAIASISSGLMSCEMLDMASQTADWILIANMSTARSYTSGTLLPDNHTFIIVGGYDFEGPLASCEKFDSGVNMWSNAASLSLYPRYAHSSVLFNNMVITMGGVDIQANILNSCEQYNPISNAWSNFPFFSAARFYFAAATVLDQIYIAGGDGFYGPTSSVEVFSGTSWSLLSSRLAQNRDYCAAVAFQNKFVVIGGSSTTIEVFDPVTSTWNTTFPPMTIAPARADLAVVSN
jgi:hypothetical protein